MDFFCFLFVRLGLWHGNTATRMQIMLSCMSWFELCELCCNGLPSIKLHATAAWGRNSITQLQEGARIWCIGIGERTRTWGVRCLSPLPLQPLAQVQVTTWYPNLFDLLFLNIDWKWKDLNIEYQMWTVWRMEIWQIFDCCSIVHLASARAGCCYLVVEWSCE